MELSSQHSHFTPSHLTHWARRDFYTEIFKKGIEMENVCDWVRSSLPPLINPSLFYILKWNIGNTSDKLGLAKPTRKGIQKTAPFRLAGGYTQKSDLSRALCLFLFLLLTFRFLYGVISVFLEEGPAQEEKGVRVHSAHVTGSPPHSAPTKTSVSALLSPGLLYRHTHIFRILVYLKCWQSALLTLETWEQISVAIFGTSPVTQRLYAMILNSIAVHNNALFCC